MARRELGDLRAARVDLERAWETAAGLDDLALAGRIATTLSLVVAYQGELASALAILDVSEPAMGGAELGHSTSSAASSSTSRVSSTPRSPRTKRRWKCSAMLPTSSARHVSTSTSAPCSHRSVA